MESWCTQGASSAQNFAVVEAERPLGVVLQLGASGLLYLQRTSLSSQPHQQLERDLFLHCHNLQMAAELRAGDVLRKLRAN